MPSRHSKSAGDRSHLSYHEKVKAGLGSVHQRVGTESQLPFGHCSLSTYPAEDPVVSPSGRIYSRESIIEYLLTKSKELKKQWKEYEEQQSRMRERMEQQMEEIRQAEVVGFKAVNEDAVPGSKRSVDDSNATSSTSDYQKKRQKLIDDTDVATRRDQLKHISPWIPQFTPHAEKTILAEPPKRPLSPFSGQPIRSKDLISISLVREDDGSTHQSSSTVRYVCPASRKTITNQKVFLIKPTGTILIEQSLKELALPSMTCPVTGQAFTKEDVLELKSAASGFAASGNVEATLHRPTMN